MAMVASFEATGRWVRRDAATSPPCRSRRLASNQSSMRRCAPLVTTVMGGRSSPPGRRPAREAGPGSWGRWYAASAPQALWVLNVLGDPLHHLLVQRGGGTRQAMILHEGT